MISRKLIIICPLFHKSGSGVSTYYKLLSDLLKQSGTEIHVISDREEGPSNGFYYRVFPIRCGRDKRAIRDIIAYGIQNISYFKIIQLIQSVNPDSILVHSSFYNHPGLFHICMKLTRKLYNGKMVLDVRDQLIPKKKIKLLSIFDNIIACSLNVNIRLQEYSQLKKRITHIPVIQENLQVDDILVTNTMRQFGLKKNKYVFYAGLIKEDKGVDLLLESFRVYGEKLNLQLVLAGHNKLKSKYNLRLLNHTNISYVGNQDRKTVLALMSAAALCINISDCEGLPRSCIEAIGLSRPVVLPKGIPEFETNCPEFIIRDNNAETIYLQIKKTIEKGKLANYPIEMHSAEKIKNDYIKLLFN